MNRTLKTSLALIAFSAALAAQDVVIEVNAANAAGYKILADAVRPHLKP